MANVRAVVKLPIEYNLFMRSWSCMRANIGSHGGEYVTEGVGLLVGAAVIDQLLDIPPWIPIALLLSSHLIGLTRALAFWGLFRRHVLSRVYPEALQRLGWALTAEISGFLTYVALSVVIVYELYWDLGRMWLLIPIPTYVSMLMFMSMRRFGVNVSKKTVWKSVILAGSLFIGSGKLAGSWMNEWSWIWVATPLACYYAWNLYDGFSTLVTMAKSSDGGLWGRRITIIAVGAPLVLALGPLIPALLALADLLDGIEGATAMSVAIPTVIPLFLAGSLFSTAGIAFWFLGEPPTWAHTMNQLYGPLVIPEDLEEGNQPPGGIEMEGNIDFNVGAGNEAVA